MPRIMLIVLLGSFLWFSARNLSGQTHDDDDSKGQAIVFHVTSVSHHDDATVCQSGECSATKFTVEGYSDTLHVGKRVKYVLTCDEYWVQQPAPHFTITCGKVHADNSYDARLFADSIAFIDNRPKPQDSPLEANYDIESEREEAVKPSK